MKIEMVKCCCKKSPTGYSWVAASNDIERNPDGHDGNKKPTEFSIEERYQLKGALIDLADRIRRAADAID